MVHALELIEKISPHKLTYQVGNGIPWCVLPRPERNFFILSTDFVIFLFDLLFFKFVRDLILNRVRELVVLV